MKAVEGSIRAGKTYLQQIIGLQVNIESRQMNLDGCPFCKGRAIHEKREIISKFFASNNHYIKCCSCNARTAGCDTPEEAAKKWNGRAE